MKYFYGLSGLMAIISAPVLSAEIGFDSIAMAYVAMPLGAKTKTSVTTYGFRFGQVDASAYQDERSYSPMNDMPTLSLIMSRPALWELQGDKWGIASIKINGVETADREFKFNSVGAIAGAASSINWGMVAAGTAATVAVAAAASTSSGSSSGTTSTTTPSSTSSGSGSSASSSSGTASPAPSSTSSGSSAPAAQNDGQENGSGDESESDRGGGRDD